MELLDGKAVSEKLIKEYQENMQRSKKKISLSVLMVGDNPSSKIYVGKKKKACEFVGIDCNVIGLPEDITGEDLISRIKSLNADSSVDAIMIQLPLPKHLDVRQVIETIDFDKDVEGLSSYHMGQVLTGSEKIIPCTPKGIIRLLDEYKIDLTGKKVCLIGYSDIVGKPLGALCLNRHATVTLCHLKTNNLKEHTKNADVVMTATGVPHLITADMITVGCIVIDIGISRQNGRIVGDVDFEKVKDKCSYITPVPGGVGPMTVAMLIDNLLNLK